MKTLRDYLTQAEADAAKLARMTKGEYPNLGVQCRAVLTALYDTLHDLEKRIIKLEGEKKEPPPEI